MHAAAAITHQTKPLRHPRLHHTHSSRLLVSRLTRKSEPPTYCTIFSSKYLLRTEPPTMAMPVATPCPATAPATTPAGEEAAARAMVARKDLSPHSAAKTSAKVDSSRPVDPAGQPAWDSGVCARSWAGPARSALLSVTVDSCRPVQHSEQLAKRANKRLH